MHNKKSKKHKVGLAMDKAQTSESIAAVLRERIALARPDTEQTFPEGQLAQEFGVSRTPVRQALQRLEYERLITIRSGVGSAVVPLEREKRILDLNVACSILTAAAECCDSEQLPLHINIQFSGHYGALTLVEEIDTAIYFSVRSQVLTAAAEIIPNHIMRDAFSAAYWRLIRWRVADFADDPHEQGQILKDQMAAIVKSAKRNRVDDVLRSLAITERDWEKRRTSQVA